MSKHRGTRQHLAGGVILLSLLLAAAEAPAGELPPPRILEIDLATSLGPLNRSLGGTTHGSANESVIEHLRLIGPPHIRIDTWFEAGPYACEKDEQGRPVVDFSAIDARVRNVRATGAEPLVIVDYMPRCLSRYAGPGFGGQPDASRHPPRDYDEWEELVYATVKHLSETDGLEVRWFEAWNEPDLPQFFQGTIDEYLAIFDRIENAIRRVESEHAYDPEPFVLGLGGPAVAFPDLLWLPRFLDHVVENGRKLDFVSWHWYASYPLFGPVYGEPPFSIPPANVENPLLEPRGYADQTHLVRELVTAAWARRADGAPEPFLWLDEWNINAGREPRHDTSEAAAFTAAVLDHMLRAGVERSSFFNVEDAEDLNFNQGMFFAHRGTAGPPDGTPKPVFATWRFWSRLADVRVPVAVGPLSGTGTEGLAELAAQQENLGAIATRSKDGTRVAVLVYNWSPRAKRMEEIVVTFPAPLSGTLEILPADARTGLDVSEPLPVSGAAVSLALDDASVALLDLGGVEKQ